MSTFRDIVDEFEDAGVSVRGAYWGGDDGYRRLVVRVAGEDRLREVASVEVAPGVDGDIVVEVEA